MFISGPESSAIVIELLTLLEHREAAQFAGRLEGLTRDEALCVLSGTLGGFLQSLRTMAGILNIPLEEMIKMLALEFAQLERT